MSRRTQVLLGGVGLVVLVAAFLFLFSQISTSHPLAKAAIGRAPEVADAVGGLHAVLLVGARQKLVPGGTSCSTNAYLAFGESGWTFVVVDLAMPARQPVWQVERLSIGWFTGPTGRC
jgi:hypothetical protein